MPMTEMNRSLTMDAPHLTTLPTAQAGSGAWGQTDARLARAGHELRRLRYYRDLIGEGFRAARMADPSLPFLAGICGPRGLLDRLVAHCEGLLAQS